ETRQFTLMNRWLLVLWVGGLGLSALLMEFVDLPAIIGGKNFILAERMGLSVLLFLGLSPVAITMALIWKTKQVILDSVFGAK
ncbi:MAG TPA: hypothetical protein VFV81_07325, partial [Verrucomicrobiae bacterium]|nr:hypothetical protein [Verrucomicrobiae bacterium]